MKTISCFLTSSKVDVITKETVTIADIAKTANVSTSTVSRVLRGTANVSDSKRDAVLKAVADLKYQPNIFAQGLASGQSMAIGVLTQNFGSPFYDSILQGVVQGLQNTNYFPIFADGLWEAEVEYEAIMRMVQRKIDGLIILGGYMTAKDLGQLSEIFPVILVARHLPDFEENCIYIDNSAASFKATKYLIELGHKRIAHVSGRPDHPDGASRLRGYKMALENFGIEIHPDLIVEGNFRRQSGVLAVENLLSKGISFSAIFAANDQMAFGVRLGLYRRGIRVPDDLSLVGFDDEPAAAFMVPPLTTVRQPAVELGQEAARIILARLKGQSISTPKLEAELVVRESSAIQR
jgi:LacI family transcriptional regulator